MGETSLKFRCRIAAFIGDPPMGIFMQDHGKEQRQRFIREGEDSSGEIDRSWASIGLREAPPPHLHLKRPRFT